MDSYLPFMTLAEAAAAQASRLGQVALPHHFFEHLSQTVAVQARVGSSALPVFEHLAQTAAVQVRVGSSALPIC